jgi:hypothetical protein
LVDKGARNDLSAAVPKFSLALEEYRRTPEGRVRTSQDLLATFFPHDDKTSTDKVFKHLPNEVRGPIIAAWGIRGMKAALRDNDERVQQVVYDALLAGDVDHQAFEEGLAPETLVRWIPLAELWAFWRGGKLSKQAIHKAMATAYELYLFDARWFLETLSAKGGSLKGTDVLADGLTKDDLTQWVRRIHETGDGTPKGLVAALGWDKIVAKTSNDVLVAVLDAVVTKVGLVVVPAKESSPKLGESAASPASPAAKVEPKPEPAAAATPAAPPAEPPKVEAAKPEPAKAEPEKPAIPAIPAIPEQRLTEKPGADEPTWSVPPAAAEAMKDSAEDGISVDLDDDVLLSSDRLAPPTAPRIAIGTQVDPEDTEVKAVPRVRSERPPGPGSRAPSKSR